MRRSAAYGFALVVVAGAGGGLVAGAGVASQVPPAENRVVSREPESSPVSAYGGRVVWSSETKSGRYALMTLVGGVPERVPVRTRPVPFDVDLGPSVTGETVAVYSRCRVETDARGAGTPYDRGRGCDIFRYDFRRRAERRLRRASTARGSEYLPAIWKRQLAFVRISPGRRGVRSVYPYLYLQDLSTGRERRIAVGTRGRYDRYDFGRRIEYDGGPGATRLDLRRSSVAYTWVYEPERCGKFRSQEERVPFSVSELWVVEPGRQRLVERECDTGEAEAPAFDGSVLTWFRSRMFEPPDRIGVELMRLEKGGPRAAALPADRRSSIDPGAQEGRSAYYFDREPPSEDTGWRFVRRQEPEFTETRLRRQRNMVPARAPSP